MGLSVLLHEATSLYRWDGGRVIPVGSLLVAEGRHPVRTLAEGVAAWHTAPWCPLVLRLPHSADVEGAAVLLPSGMAAAMVLRLNEPHDAQTLRGLTQQRPPPTRTDICAYLSCRVHPMVMPLLEGRVLGLPVTVGTRRRMARARVGTPGEWATLAQTTIWLSQALAQHWSESSTAGAGGVSPKTLSARCRRLYGLSWQRLMALPAWEALVESGVRRVAPGVLRTPRSRGIRGNDRR